ncbi:MAG TPA: type VI secretion system membrane subunit TssM, partial [Polyangiaceae bacterium]|nr:type VI secretion system membrane subunit TssM [Polyangiaceae bacterium]
KPVKYYLERKLKSVEGERYYQERELLKTYLMLSDVEHLDIDWATGRFTALWAELQKSTSDVALVDLKKKMLPHVRYYLELIKPEGEDKPRATPVPANAKIVERTRKTLMEVPVSKRYYSLFVDSISHELYDPAQDRIRSNLQFPPVTLETIFTDRPEVLKWLSSKKHKADKKWYEVSGPYTDKGHFAVLANIKEAKEVLESERWVVPLTEEEKQPDRVAANIKRLADDYERRYIDSWEDFLLDVEVRTPVNLEEAIELYAVLQKPEWPYLRLLRRLEDHTQWKGDLKGLKNDKANSIINRRMNRYLSSKTRGLRFGLDITKIGDRASRVPNTFKKTVGFGVPQDGAKSPLNETPLAQYMDIIGRLREEMVQARETNPDASINVVARKLQTAVKETEALLQTRDDMAKRTLLPLLQNPLNVGGNIRLSSHNIGG